MADYLNKPKTVITNEEDRALMLQYLREYEEGKQPDWTEERANWIVDQIDAYDNLTKTPSERVNTPNALGGFEGDMTNVERQAAQVNMGLHRFKFNAEEAALRLGKVVAGDMYAPFYNSKIDAVDAKRKDYLNQSAIQFAKDGFGEPNEFLVSMYHDLPLLPLAFIPAARSETFVRSLLWNSGEGALAGGLYGMETPGNSLWDASLGALIGAGATLAFNIPSGIRSYAGRKWVAMEQEGLAEEALALEKRIREVTKDEEFAFSMANIVGDSPVLESLEKGAISRNREALQRQKKNLRTLISYLDTRLDELANPKVADVASAGPLERAGPNVVTRPTSAQLVTDLGKLMSRISREQHAQARNSYQIGMNYLMDNHAGAVTMRYADGERYLENLETLFIKDAGIGSGKVPPALREHWSYLDARLRPAEVRPIYKDGKPYKYAVYDRNANKQIALFDTPDGAQKFRLNWNKRNGELTAEDTLAVMKSFNEMIAGKRNIFDTADPGSSDHIGRFLKKSFIESLQGSDSTVQKAIDKVNLQYRMDMAEIDLLSNKYIAKIFGGDQAALAADPTKFLDELLVDATYDSLRQTRDVLNAHAPALLPLVQREYLQRIMQQSRQPAFSKGAGEVDLDTLLVALSGRGGKTNVGRAGFGLFDNRTQSELAMAAKGLTVLRNTAMNVGQRDAAVVSRMEDIGINLVSQSAEFMSRLGVRLLGSSRTVAEVLTDPNARKALEVFAREGPNTIAARTAAIFLATWYGDWEQEEADQILSEQSLKGAVGD